MEDNHTIQWFFNDDNFNDQTYYAYTEAVEQSLASAIAQFMVQHAEISIYINFEKSKSVSAAVAAGFVSLTNGLIDSENDMQIVNKNTLYNHHGSIVCLNISQRI